MHIINEDKYPLEPALAEKLLTSKQGLHAGGTSDKDLIDCPKLGQKQYEICKDCQFSVPLDHNSLDSFGV